MGIHEIHGIDVADLLLEILSVAGDHAHPRRSPIVDLRREQLRDFSGIGSADMARNIVSVVMDAPIPTPMAAIISTVSTTLRFRLPAPIR
jgi:hypothetical protein